MEKLKNDFKIEFHFFFPQPLRNKHPDDNVDDYDSPFREVRTGCKQFRRRKDFFLSSGCRHNNRKSRGHLVIETTKRQTAVACQSAVLLVIKLHPVTVAARTTMHLLCKSTCRPLSTEWKILKLLSHWHPFSRHSHVMSRDTRGTFVLRDLPWKFS